MNPLRHALTPLRAWLLALLLLAAQSAGLAHRVAHAGTGGQAVAQARWLPDHQQGTTDCRLIDQLAHADVLCGPALSPVALLPLAQASPAPLALPLRAAPPAVYQARAPPAFERV